MTLIRIPTFMALALGLSACAAPQERVAFQTYASPAEATRLDTGGILGAAPAAPQTPAEAGFVITGVQIDVPRTLTVSEANSYLPRADIVWRGDLPGDRHQQIEALFRDAMADGIATLGDTGTRPVTLQITLKRFHGVTERTRYTMGGVHNVIFDLAFLDPETGALLAPVREVAADLKEPGGDDAIAADAAGQTQKVRLRAHLAQVLVDEMTQPGGHANARLGIVQRMNRL